MLTEIHTNIQKIDNRLLDMKKRQDVLLRSIGSKKDKRSLPAGPGFQAARDIKLMRWFHMY